eukprot:CAMPEP_0177784172 /NCGR_PEP_ID=MMETSP0491_2-20121128/19534_1 /TAXON_ID=63592 /ORGANISM="Tetraselmis chuii, Strain PLY429" /LENGTH=280 /DNA_ID=CAMNT_0019304871 /DNA_START=293 /DNA_END=1135 /DNA_ORIENTATION=-
MIDRWKALLVSSLMDSDRPTRVEYRYAGRGAAREVWRPGVSREEVLREIRDPSAPRFMFVRNPYVRLLSGFLDKALAEYNKGGVKVKIRSIPFLKALGGPFEDSPSGFLAFTRACLAQHRRGRSVNAHWEAQSRASCGVRQGMQYDFYLKVEDIDIWYIDFMSLTGLQNAAQAMQPCFHSLPGMTCNRTDAATRQARGTGVVATSGAGATPSCRPYETSSINNNSITVARQHMRGWEPHETGAQARLLHYYTSQDVIDAATEFLMDDLIAFQYPVLSLSS